MMERVPRKYREYALTAGELGSAGGQTLMVALLPVLLAPYAPSAVWIGAVVGAEGLFALFLPYIAGAMSDRLPERLARRFGRRSFFLILSAPVMALALVFAPFQDGFWRLAIPAFVFFAGLHMFMTPLRALVIAAVPEGRWGRVQGVLGAFHAGGLGYGLVAGGLLFALWQPLPFFIAAGLVLLMTGITYVATPSEEASSGGQGGKEPAESYDAADRDPDGGSVGGGNDAGKRSEGGGAAARSGDQERDGNGGGGEQDASRKGGSPEAAFLSEVAGRPEVRWYLIANSLWTGSVDGLRPYIFLFATIVLGITVAQASLVLAALLAGAGVGSILVGALGDRYGRGRVLFVAALLTGLVMLTGTFIRSVPVALAVLVPAGFGAAALISLPYAVFAKLARSNKLGHYTGVYIMSQGVARFIAPLVVGVAVDLGTAVYPDLEGYPFIWPVVGCFALLSVAALWQANRAAEGALLARSGGGEGNE